MEGAGLVEDGVGDGRGDRDDGGFAGAGGLDVGVADDGDVDAGAVVAAGHSVAGEVAVEQAAGLEVVHSPQRDRPLDDLLILWARKVRLGAADNRAAA